MTRSIRSLAAAVALLAAASCTPAAPSTGGQLSSIEPSTGRVGAEVKVKVNGSGFTPLLQQGLGDQQPQVAQQVTALVDGVAVPTTFISDGQLEITLPAGLSTSSGGTHAVTATRGDTTLAGSLTYTAVAPVSVVFNGVNALNVGQESAEPIQILNGGTVDVPVTISASTDPDGAITVDASQIPTGAQTVPAGGSVSFTQLIVTGQSAGTGTLTVTLGLGVTGVTLSPVIATFPITVTQASGSTSSSSASASASSSTSTASSSSASSASSSSSTGSTASTGSTGTSSSSSSSNASSSSSSSSGSTASSSSSSSASSTASTSASSSASSSSSSSSGSTGTSSSSASSSSGSSGSSSSSGSSTGSTGSTSGNCSGPSDCPSHESCNLGTNQCESACGAGHSACSDGCCDGTSCVGGTAQTDCGQNGGSCLDCSSASATKCMGDGTCGCADFTDCPGANQACDLATSTCGSACGTASYSNCNQGGCVGGTCQSNLANGSLCTGFGECTSHNCVDGVCCDLACNGACQACTQAKKGSGADGTCGDIAAGHDPDAECTASCAVSTLTPSSCDGAGACAAGTPAACGGELKCANTTSCLSGCGTDDATGDANCVTGNWCDGQSGGACQAPQGTGSTCNRSSQCSSGTCTGTSCN